MTLLYYYIVFSVLFACYAVYNAVRSRGFEFFYESYKKDVVLDDGFGDVSYKNFVWMFTLFCVLILSVTWPYFVYRILSE